MTHATELNPHETESNPHEAVEELATPEQIRRAFRARARVRRRGSWQRRSRHAARDPPCPDALRPPRTELARAQPPDCDFGTQTRCRAGRPYLDAPRAHWGRSWAGMPALRDQACVPMLLPFRRGRSPLHTGGGRHRAPPGQGGGGPYAEDLACLGDRRAAGAVTGAILFARRVNRWGATAEELSRPLPGDDQVPDPLAASTRAVSIRAPASAVWPWLVQMGWRRAGWYSYDRIDNERIPSADRIMPQLQELRPGESAPEGPGAGWTVTTVKPGRLLLLTTHGPMRGVSWVLRRDSSWLFQLDDLGAGHCRLIERARTAIITDNDTVTGKLISTPLGAAGAVPRRLRDGPPPHAGDQAARRSPWHAITRPGPGPSPL